MQRRAEHRRTHRLGQISAGQGHILGKQGQHITLGQHTQGAALGIDSQHATDALTFHHLKHRKQRCIGRESHHICGKDIDEALGFHCISGLIHDATTAVLW
jgi:hypothetical protein